ncbi:hypothetical protein F4774DRAFT_164297 [Daldinia eschscholtzii]|nr:hypothetical protein F4774DRAFT_164297 [Daldinia eschscholtzii]
MADCGLPFPVVCIQCGRGVGLCGIKIIANKILISRKHQARPLVSVSRYAPQLSAGPLPFSFVASLRQARSGFGNPAISMLKYQIYSLSDQGGAIMSKELECFLCLILGHGGPVMIYYSWHITMGIEGNLMDQE